MVPAQNKTAVDGGIGMVKVRPRYASRGGVLISEMNFLNFYPLSSALRRHIEKMNGWPRHLTKFLISPLATGVTSGPWPGCAPSCENGVSQSPLFDAPHIARNVEVTFRTIWRR